MPKKSHSPDPLFQKAEQLANDFSLFPRNSPVAGARNLDGLVSESRVKAELRTLRRLGTDAYIERTVLPAGRPGRPGAKAILRRLHLPLVRQVESGPLYAAEAELAIDGRQRRVGVLAQERTAANGVWQPEHHRLAVSIIRDYVSCSLPIICLIDTPGAEAGAEANRENQAQCISRLIAEMTQVDVPNIGIVLGLGYSGGAIPLAAGNILLSVRDGVFNTIQPPGLASIARKYDLSWQECAKYVGVSAYELYEQGYIDGIIDYAPDDGQEKLENLRDAIASGIRAVEHLAMHFVSTTPAVFQHYQRSVHRYLHPSPALQRLEAAGDLSLAECPTAHVSVFGVAYRYLRYLGLRRRLRTSSIDRYGRLSSDEAPKGDLSERLEREHRQAFEKWLERPLEIRYDEVLQRAWKRLAGTRRALGAHRGRLTSLLLGSRAESFERARRELVLTYAFHLYNLWKEGAAYNFRALVVYLRETKAKPSPDNDALSILDVIIAPDVRNRFISECENLLIFDHIYDRIIAEQGVIARDAREANVISRETVATLLEAAISQATAGLAAQNPGQADDPDYVQERLRGQFSDWLRFFAYFHRRGDHLKTVADWKKIAYPRVPEPLFAIITFFFEHLLPRYYRSARRGRAYDGRLTPRDIGVKDFWNRLDMAYRDLQLERILLEAKRSGKITPQAILDRFFDDVEELDAHLITDDPVRFPGFRLSIDQAVSRGITPCGVITAIARRRQGKASRRVGVLVSNLAFQAGAFDMASAEKFCRLLRECARLRLPIIAFISSSGMQTKEGAGALFSMAIVNDRLTRFVRDTELPVLVFGFGDCTGGAQASLVTHPLVQTYYFSGTNMPFAGQIVVPTHLPLTATLANYLSAIPGSMQGLVRHPFADGLDEALREMDPAIPIGGEDVDDVIPRVLRGALEPEPEQEAPVLTARDDLALLRPFDKVLVHARGCTATKLIRVAQRRRLGVVLVQSDADMDSQPVDLLGEGDQLICLGGNTPDESYLNAHSVVRVAEREGLHALHPGIGFLSENAAFANLCRSHGINFIGPTVHSMEVMGNKSNAINTARDLAIPVVPGSHGIVTSPEAAARVAADIGFPVIIKAVYGGGGKGIQVVEDPADFRDLFLRIGSEARSAFGSSDCYIEKFISSFRHIEVQVLRDSQGNTKVLGLRDCSVQRQNQKLIEESGSTLLPAELQSAAYAHAGAIADAVCYLGAGTVEFIFDLRGTALYFMEMNTRLQVEHPVTEQVSGVDIVGAQFDIAAGGSIADLTVGQDGYAMELRINAERASLDERGRLQFIPDPGRVTRCDLPEQDGLEVISAVGNHKVVSPYYDSLLVQVIAHGPDRESVIERLAAYLDEVRIEGLCTNIPLLKRVLADAVFRAGDYDTAFLDGLLQRLDIQELIKAIEQSSGTGAATLSREAIAIEGSDELKVLAPSDGIFYLRPAPNETDFAAEGQCVGTEQTLCLLEAMKLFRGISLGFYNQDGVLYPADQEYEVVRINPSNGKAVHRGELLFVVHPTGPAANSKDAS